MSKKEDIEERHMEEGYTKKRYTEERYIEEEYLGGLNIQGKDIWKRIYKEKIGRYKGSIYSAGTNKKNMYGGIYKR